MTDDELESPTSDDLELMLMNEDATSILAAFAELRQERDLLLEAVEAIPIDSYCPWCKQFIAEEWTKKLSLTDGGHASDCLRQRALEVKP